MVWLISLACLVVCVAGVAVVVGINRVRFKHRVEGEERALLALAAPRAVVRATSSQQDDADLPAPVERYRQLAMSTGLPVRTLRLEHHGTFRMSVTAKPAPIVGHQLFTSDPPGFVWTGRIQLFPGVWVHARDMCIGGRGSMRVLIDDTVALVDARGAEIDQGSALRLLAEMPWYPSALFDRRWVTWQPLDAAHARAILRTGAQEVSGIFEFGVDGLLVGIAAQRFMAKEGLKPWGGVYRAWRNVSGMRVPSEVEVWWQLDAERFTYAHWFVDAFAFDAAT